MALICNMTLNYLSMVAGQSPAPQATLTVYNPNASAVAVTGVVTSVTTLLGQTTTATNLPMAPIGPGAVTVVPALSSLTFGPFAVTTATTAAGSSFQAVTMTGNPYPVNAQGSQPLQQTLLLGALVYGSDGSANVSGAAPFLLSYFPPPPQGFQGGSMFLFAPNNLALALTSGVL